MAPIKDDNGYFKGRVDATLDIVLDAINEGKHEAKEYYEEIRKQIKEINDKVDENKNDIDSQITVVNDRVDTLYSWKNNVLGACAVLTFTITLIFDPIVDWIRSLGVKK